MAQIESIALVFLVPALMFLIYRLNKRYNRRCTCGSLRFKWHHKLRRLAQYKGWYYESDTYRKCLSPACGKYAYIKGETKCFLAIEVWWRHIFHPDQFERFDEARRNAGIPVTRVPVRRPGVRIDAEPVVVDLRQQRHVRTLNQFQCGQFKRPQDRWKRH